MRRMRTLLFVVVGILLSTTIIFLSQRANATNFGALTARAIVQGTSDSGISGEVFFVQTRRGTPSTVRIIAKVQGLTPNARHGFHIHETGACTPSFTNAGGHLDPGPFGQSNPDTNHPYHMGDIPNLRANANGVAVFEYVTSRITLSEGPLSVFDDNGSALIVHQNEDQGITGDDRSGVSGGPRIACGIIEQA